VAITVLVVNGPNLNLLGEREPDVYGSDTLDDLIRQLDRYATDRGVVLRHVQSNIEGELVDTLHAARGEVDGIVLNAGAYTHYSIALRDAIAAIDIPVVETHLSNVLSREEFRHQSVIGPECIGMISGFGATSYKLAVDALIDHLS
jgi:3-dehydroquinate dehydratase-2